MESAVWEWGEVERNGSRTITTSEEAWRDLQWSDPIADLSAVTSQLHEAGRITVRLGRHALKTLRWHSDFSDRVWRWCRESREWPSEAALLAIIGYEAGTPGPAVVVPNLGVKVEIRFEPDAAS